MIHNVSNPPIKVVFDLDGPTKKKKCKEKISNDLISFTPAVDIGSQ